jgi:ribosomal protein L11 methyltransferase
VIRLAVRVRRDQAELVLAELLELAPAGVEEVQIAAEMVEYAVYGAPGELPRLPDLKAAVGEARVQISTSEIPDDWHERWRRFHKPVLIGPPLTGHGEQPPVPALHVRPPWEGPHAGPHGEVIEIVIDPGQAFGTGGHASTRLCLELLLELSASGQARGPLLDVGAGSGVLAIAGAQLGFDPVLALDHEPESVEAARKNAVENGVEIEVRHFDLRSEGMPWMGAADRPSSAQLVIVANLLRPLLMELARTLPSAPAHLLAGGLLAEEVDELTHAFGERLKLRERERRESGEWAAVWLQAS